MDSNKNKKEINIQGIIEGYYLVKKDDKNARPFNFTIDNPKNYI